MMTDRPSIDKLHMNAGIVKFLATGVSCLINDALCS